MSMWIETPSGIVVPVSPPRSIAELSSTDATSIYPEPLMTADGHREAVRLRWNDDWGWGWLYDWMVNWIYTFDDDEPVPHPLEYWDDLPEQRRAALIDARAIMLNASVVPETRAHYGALHVQLDDSNWDCDASEEWAYAGKEYDPEGWDTDAQVAAVRVWNAFDERERLLFAAWWRDFEGFPGVEVTEDNGLTS